MNFTFTSQMAAIYSQNGSKISPAVITIETRSLPSHRGPQTQRRTWYPSFFQNPLGGQPSRQEHHREASAGVRAAADEVEVAVPVVPVVRPQVPHLHETVAQAERSPLRQVVDAEPVARRVADLTFQVLFQVVYARTCCQAMDHGRTSTRLQGIPVLSDASIQMPGGNQYHQGVLARRSRRWISTRRRMHVEARFIREQVISEDAVETGAVLARQEHIVGPKLRIDRIDSPIEHDGRARVLQALQAACLGPAGQ